MPIAADSHAARTLAPLLVMVSLAACATVPDSSGPKPGFSTAGQRSATLPAAGLEAVMGRSASDLQRMFGEPRLTVREADALKLQFSNGQCVLDAYLYPEGSGGAEVVTYVDARRGDGQPVDRAACVKALRR